MNRVIYTIKECWMTANFKLSNSFSSYEPPKDSTKPEDIEYWKEMEELSKPVLYEVYVELLGDNEESYYVQLSSATLKKLTKEEFENGR